MREIPTPVIDCDVLDGTLFLDLVREQDQGRRSTQEQCYDLLQLACERCFDEDLEQLVDSESRRDPTDRQNGVPMPVIVRLRCIRYRIFEDDILIDGTSKESGCDGPRYFVDHFIIDL